MLAVGALVKALESPRALPADLVAVDKAMLVVLLEPPILVVAAAVAATAAISVATLAVRALLLLDTQSKGKTWHILQK